MLTQIQARSGGPSSGCDGRRASGFTLIELLVVVAIIGILASIAYPSYQNYVVNSRRAAATACLMERASFMERHYTTQMSYQTSFTNPQLGCQGELAAFYTFPTPSPLTATTFTLSAVPQGHQAARDTRCATLTLTHTGVRGISGGTGTAANCW